MQDNIMSAFDDLIKVEELLRSYEVDKEQRFKNQTGLVVACAKTINIHKKAMEVDKDSPEAEAYANLYANFSLLFNKYLAYIDHYDYASASKKFDESTGKTLSDIAREMAKLVEQLKALDNAYNEINHNSGIEEKDTSFWKDAPYYTVKGKSSISVPTSKRARRKNRFWGIGGIIILIAMLALYGFAAYSGSNSEVDVYTVNVSQPTKEKHTVAEWWYYEHSQIKPTENNVVSLFGNEVVVGKVTLKDLEDLGFVFTPNSYVNEFDKDGEHYIVHHEDLYYSFDEEKNYKSYEFDVKNPNKDKITLSQYNDLYSSYAPGFGMATINYDDYSSIEFTFCSFQDCENTELDFSQCIVNGISLRYYQDASELDFNYHGVSQGMLIEDVLVNFDAADITSESEYDSDNDNIVDNIVVTHQLDNHMQTYIYSKHFVDSGNTVTRVEVSYY